MGTTLNKDVINHKNTLELAQRIAYAYPSFDICSFHNEIMGSIPDQSMGERIQQVKKSLYNFLPKKYKEAVNILILSLPDDLETDSLDMLDLAGPNGFINISLTSYISSYGIDDFDTSMQALKKMTKCFSAEGPVRYFIERYPVKCNDLFLNWAKDPSPHVRRLVSEGLRPRLPMTIALKIYKIDPSPILPFLEILKNDKHLFVRRSVANNLNDISKDHPEFVVKILKEWNKDKTVNMQWLIKHALRTLERAGNKEALCILGYTPPPKELEVSKLSVKNINVELGGKLTFNFEIKSKVKTPPLLIDYIIYFKKSNGSLFPKIFKLKKLLEMRTLQLEIEKEFCFKEISTRRYYPGEHTIALQINGKVYKSSKFTLFEP
jgi:3-methyladenine DNA glycosylase AlkC